MDSEIIKKALNIGIKISELTSKDGNERAYFFTKDAQTIMAKGHKDTMDFLKISKRERDKITKFHKEHRYKEDFSSIHSHPYDATFSVGDIQKCVNDWNEDRICYHFVVTSKNLFALFIPLNIKQGLKFSKKLETKLIELNREIWKNVGVNKFEKISYGIRNGKKLWGFKPIHDEIQKERHDVIWNEKFLEFFNKRWNYINQNQLEYEEHGLIV